MLRILIILIATLYSISPGYGQAIEQTVLDSNCVWYHGELNKNKSSLIDAPLEPIGWVNDYEHILTKNQICLLDSIIATFEKQTTIEIAVLTVDSTFAQPDEFDNMVTTMGRIWGVGKKDVNNGIIIGASSSLKKIRISNGYGIEKVLSDSETKKIIDETIIPEFKNGNFYEGIKEGVLAIIRKLS